MIVLIVFMMDLLVINKIILICISNTIRVSLNVFIMIIFTFPLFSYLVCNCIDYTRFSFISAHSTFSAWTKSGLCNIIERK